MTASTPRITEQQARARFSNCNGLCNSGRLCTCREPADMGTTLGFDAVSDPVQQAIGDARSHQHAKQTAGRLDVVLTVVIAIVAAWSLSGCTRPDDARRVLESAGYSNIELHGYDFLNCSDDDMYHDKFTANGPTGKPVSGVVCAGMFFKGATIRLD